MAVDLHYGKPSSRRPNACHHLNDHSAKNVSQQGIITICLGIMGYIFIVDFPDRSTQPQLVTRRPFLTPSEAAIIKAHGV